MITLLLFLADLFASISLVNLYMFVCVCLYLCSFAKELLSTPMMTQKKIVFEQ